MAKKRRPRKANSQSRLLILAGVLSLAAAVLLLKGVSKAPAAQMDNAGELPAAQLQVALSEGRPTLAFFHSTTCDQCLEMTDVVAEVYPEFTETITLVDVNVYDKRNATLLNQMRIKITPHSSCSTVRATAVSRWG